MLGTTSASHAGSSSASSSWSRRPLKTIALGQPPRGLQIALAALAVESLQKGQQVTQRCAHGVARRGALGGLVAGAPRGFLAGALGRLLAGALQRATGAGDVDGFLQASRGERGQQALQGGPVGAEADDHERRGRHALEHERPRGEQQVDALADDQLADEGDEAAALPVDRRRHASRACAAASSSRANALGGSACREAPVTVARDSERSTAAAEAPARRRAARVRTARSGSRSRSSSPTGRKWCDVDAGRTETGARGQLGVGERRPQAVGGVPRADEHRARSREPLAGVAQEALWFGLDGVLERAPVDLHRVGHPVERAREDRGAHDQVVGERDLGAHARGDLAHGGDVGGEVAIDLLRRCTRANVRAWIPS